MDAIKKNPVLSAVVAICVIVFVAGAVLAFLASGSASKAKDNYERMLDRQQRLVRADPAPTPANVDAASRNLVELESALKEIRDDLLVGAQLSQQSNWTIVNTDIQSYITEIKRYASEADVRLGTDKEVFGFARYLAPVAPPREEFVPIIDKQRQILQYILRSLIDSKPEIDPTVGAYNAEIQAKERESKSLLIMKAEREVVEALPNTPAAVTGFRIDPAISARVEGAIDTLAFRVTFRANTTALRNFLNQLADFEMPIVVRSIEVDRPEASSSASGGSAPSAATSLDSIFGGGGGASAGVETEEPSVDEEPVIEEVSSVFTVTLEFLEILLPEVAEEPASPDSDE